MDRDDAYWARLREKYPLDPDGAHAITFGKLCKCGAELCHPDEIKSGVCYPCSAKK